MLENKRIKTILWICSVFLFFSCDYFTFEKKSTADQVIAKFEDKVLLFEDIANQFPKDLKESDSLLALKRIIDDWALQKILIKKAQLNNSTEINAEIEELVNEYRESLLINRYKEELIQQELDTVILPSEIDSYYENNKNNFRLNEIVIQARYLTFDKDLIDKKEIIKIFKRGTIEDLEELETKQLSFKQTMLNDSLWVSLNDLLKRTTFERDELLKKSQLVQKEDSINLFLAVVKDLRQKNEIAPQDYILDNIKAILLHKRKIEVIREIEKILLKDAIKENQLIYK